MNYDNYDCPLKSCTAKHVWNLWEISMWKLLEATGVTNVFPKFQEMLLCFLNFGESNKVGDALQQWPIFLLRFSKNMEALNESWKSPIRRADISRNDEMEIVHPLQNVKDTQNI